MGRRTVRPGALLLASFVFLTCATTGGEPSDVGADAGDVRDGDGGACDAERCQANCVAAGYLGGDCSSGICVCINNPDADADGDLDVGPDADADADADADVDSGVSASAVLVLFEECGGGLDHITPAIAAAGLTAVTTFSYDAASFGTQLTSRTWDLVVVDEYSNNLDSTTLDDLNAHVLAGGSLILSYWDLYWGAGSHTLLTRFGVTLTGSYTVPQSIYAWSTTGVFDVPNTVPDLTSLLDTCDTDGQTLTATTATVHAGYSTSDTVGQAALTVSADGRVVLNAFTPQLVSQDADGDGVQDMVELYENELRWVR